ncbi:MAG: S24 family peptidase, partial [Armatimonadetes bacterium]|nr:S24 family peptidase [Armatimonadota bacterium]
GADQAEEWFDLRRRWLNRLDGVLEVHGDSMQPLLQEGDLLGLRALALDELPEIGEVCVVWLPNLGEVVVKIYAGCRQREVALLSSNLEYPPMFLPLDQAVPRARVTSILRSAALRIRLEEWEYWPGPRG